MSYIAFDLDALNRAPAVARSAGVTEEQVIAGLVRMWAWAFREETDSIDIDQLRGHFGVDASKALVAFGFLETSGPVWRVRGASRYLRIKSAQREAAKRTNARKGTAPPSERSTGAVADAPPDAPPPLERRSTDATPHGQPPLFTEHRAPNTKSTAPASPTPPVSAPKAPRLEDLLCEDFKEVTGAKYDWKSAKDGVAFAALLKVATIEEIRARWRAGLKAPAEDWASCRGVAQLRSKWNDLVDLAKKPTHVPLEERPSRQL
jgi:hypothetical protein